MKPLLILIFTVFFGLRLFATAQYPDKVIYNGKEYSLQSNPLESFFKENPDKLPKSEIVSTALWRGYVATFEVRDNQLYVKDIEIEVSDTSSTRTSSFKWKSVLNEVFPGQKEVKVEWITGLLVMPYGKIVNYVHMGYGSTYEFYTLLEFEKGNLVREKNFKYDEYEKFKERQFQAFKMTEDYKRLKARLQKKDDSDESIDSFLRSFVTDYTSIILTE
ncbi:MAG TPA: hypothetical protein VL443_09485 [Cyclobacteriaceae bacterium]|jgi:hypothetical protein|nr:hypothetical protein [Cyclobacteriaceae bacterium]